MRWHPGPNNGFTPEIPALGPVLFRRACRGCVAHPPGTTRCDQSQRRKGLALLEARRQRPAESNMLRSCADEETRYRETIVLKRHTAIPAVQ